MKNRTFNSLEDLYDFAVQDIKDQLGTITIQIGGVPKISKSNDIIGNCVQEWIPQWLEDNGLELESNQHTQQFPDFTALLGGKRYDMEVKCWNCTNPPGFDLANFDGFYRSIYTDPKKLNAKYLIFGYKPTTHGFRIENIYLKNIWELTKPASKYPIGLQVKQNRPYAIRPFGFHKRPEDSFKNRKEFVRGIQQTRIQFPSDNVVSPSLWFESVEANFKKMTGEEL